MRQFLLNQRDKVPAGALPVLRILGQQHAQDLSQEGRVKPGSSKSVISELTPARKCIGNVQYRPYTAEGPVEESPGDLRAVTLFELEDLVRSRARRTST